MNRRNFIASAPALIGAASAASSDSRPQAPAVTRPRATFGDAIEPQWEQRVTITVGPEKADLVGSDHRLIQAAVDYVSGLGGGTVQILPGKYVFRNAVKLRSGVRILGSGTDSVCTRGASTKTLLLENSDWYDQEVTLTCSPFGRGREPEAPGPLNRSGRASSESAAKAGSCLCFSVKPRCCV